jgi:hypothetical protein
VEAPLDLVAEPIESLADVVTRQRRRCDAMLLEPPYRTLPSSHVLKGNGSDDDSGG